LSKYIYAATKSERKILVEPPYDYNSETINLLEDASHKVRLGILIDFLTAISVCEYQSNLQEIRKHQKKWWHFGHKNR